MRSSGVRPLVFNLALTVYSVLVLNTSDDAREVEGCNRTSFTNLTIESPE